MEQWCHNMIIHVVWIPRSSPITIFGQNICTSLEYRKNHSANLLLKKIVRENNLLVFHKIMGQATLMLLHTTLQIKK